VRAAARWLAAASAHRIDLTLAHYGCEWNDPSSRTHAVFENPPLPVDGLFRLTGEPGLGLRLNEAELANRKIAIA
jgi:L-alanine-DL-glutamate epimerase-like enolase superfamily enzyme